MRIGLNEPLCYKGKLVENRINTAQPFFHVQKNEGYHFCEKTSFPRSDSSFFFRGIDQWRETVQVNEIELITDWELAHKQEEGLLRQLRLATEIPTFSIMPKANIL